MGNTNSGKNILKRYDYSDTNMTITLGPVWTFQGSACDVSVDGLVDSTFQDTNLFSDTYNAISYRQTYNYCSCSTPALHPDYKIVNGQCEEGVTCNTASSYIKVINPDNTYYWTWRCTYHYQWSDGSISGNYYRYNLYSGCALGCIGAE